MNIKGHKLTLDINNDPQNELNDLIEQLSILFDNKEISKYDMILSGILVQILSELHEIKEKIK